MRVGRVYVASACSAQEQRPAWADSIIARLDKLVQAEAEAERLREALRSMQQTVVRLSDQLAARPELPAYPSLWVVLSSDGDPIMAYRGLEAADFLATKYRGSRVVPAYFGPQEAEGGGGS